MVPSRGFFAAISLPVPAKSVLSVGFETLALSFTFGFKASSFLPIQRLVENGAALGKQTNKQFKRDSQRLAFLLLLQI